MTTAPSPTPSLITSIDDATDMLNELVVHRRSPRAEPAPSSTLDAAATPSPLFNLKPHPPIPLMQLIQSITTSINDYCDLNALHTLMSSYDAALNEWRRYAFYDSSKKYTRNLIATDHTHFTLMLLCWNPRQASPIHNHSGSECFMRVIAGRVQESQYERIADSDTTTQHDGQLQCGTPLKLKRRGLHGPGAVLFINDSIGLHKIENVFDEPAVTLHLYIPPYEECQCYDEATGQAKTAFTTFYSEHGEVLEAHD